MTLLEQNKQNYWIYSEFITNRSIVINTSDINASTWQMHFDAIMNIIKDGIETDYVHKYFITVVFNNGQDIDLTVPDYYFNLIMWQLKVSINEPIMPRDIFFEDAITIKGIKQYIDTLFIGPNRTKLSNIEINNIIDDCMYNFSKIEAFNFYLANTINLEDTIDLMNKYPEFNNLIHIDLSNVPIEDIKSKGMEATNKIINYIKNNDHCLAPFFKSKEGINPKQFKESFVNIGTKPDGQGSVYNAPINRSFITGGVNDYLSYFIESATGRVAQIIVEGNTGDSGHFARLLGLNNIDTFINPNPDFSCNTKNLLQITIDDATMLMKFENRYYRMIPEGIERVLTRNDTHLIGQTIYLRSPMTCDSFAHGHGICYRCYGNLAFTNYDINVGRMASEILSSKLTQMMLSAKHLLDTSIKKLNWTSEFQMFCDLDSNIIKLVDMDWSGYKITIDPEDITLEDDLSKDTKEYVTSFNIIDPHGEVYSIHTSDLDNMYITYDLNDEIRSTARPEDGRIVIDCINLVDMPLFMIHLHNNDLSRTLDLVTDYIDNIKMLKSCNNNMTEILQGLNRTVINANLNVASIHNEVILANQIRNAEDILEMPDWSKANEPYQMLTLKQALGNNPSIVITLSFERLQNTLYNPLTYRKHKPSFMDLFFMVKPQDYMVSNEANSTYVTKEEETEIHDLLSFADDSE